VFEHLASRRIHPSLRHTRDGRAHLRFSPHYYNTLEEMDRVIDAMAGAPV
jgi:selenocysteine lyase/cysteine desulfurase